VIPFTAKGRATLAEVAMWFGIGAKGEEIVAAKNKRLEDFSPEALAQYMRYCANDTRLSWLAYKLLWQKFEDHQALEECELIDLTIKKFTRPQLHFDMTALEAGAVEAEQTRTALIHATIEPLERYLGPPVSTTAKPIEWAMGILNSSAKLAKVITLCGCEVPQKVSIRTNKLAPAFSKADPEFLQFLNPRLPTTIGEQDMKVIAAGRLAAKSSQETNRFARFLQIARSGPRPMVAVPLLYYGAHTGRLSGLDKLNMQNMGQHSKLRRSLRAPRGYKVVAGDSSQIEARITACLAGQLDMVEDFRAGRDVYSSFATSVYHRPIDKINFPKERFVGKQGILSLQFGVGVIKFHQTLNNVHHLPISLEECSEVVETYRTKYSMVPDLWSKMRQALRVMSGGGEYWIRSLKFTKGQVELPNGMPIFYPNLAYNGTNFCYQRKGELVKIYPAKLLENCVQALARIVLTDAELRLAHTGIRAAHSVHDELIYVVPEAVARVFCKALHKALCAPKGWLPDLPLDCEVKFADSYADTK
jgi:DNA polymerase